MEGFKTVAVVKMPKVNLDKTWSKSSAKLFQRNLTSLRQKGVDKCASALQQGLYDSLESNTWSWPRDTLRVNGSMAGTTRTIYDTGGLYSSQKLATSHQVTQSKLTVTYSAPYASLVHYGGYVQPYGNKNANTVLIPARPWVDAVLNGTHGQDKIDLGKILLDTITTGLGDFVI